MTYRLFFCCVCQRDSRFVWQLSDFICGTCGHYLCRECTNAHHEKEATA